jgi:hypothetical protein
MNVSTALSVQGAMEIAIEICTRMIKRVDLARSLEPNDHFSLAVSPVKVGDA